MNQGTTQTTVASAGSIHFGEVATFTATVSSTAGTPTGNVAFLDGVTSLGTAALSSGVATFNTGGLALGTHSITARYLGSSDYLASTSAATSQDVTAPAITIDTGRVGHGFVIDAINRTDLLWRLRDAAVHA